MGQGLLVTVTPNPSLDRFCSPGTLELGRLNRLGEAGYDVPALVHPRAYVSPSAVVEPGAVVLAMACVGTHTLVRRGAIINMGAVIDHDCTVGFCVHAAPGAIVKAGNFLAPMTKVESGQVVERAAYPAP